MPRAFENCVKAGGRVRTLKPNAKTYIKVCFPKGGGPSIRGEVHHKLSAEQLAKVAKHARKKAKKK